MRAACYRACTRMLDDISAIDKNFHRSVIYHAVPRILVAGLCRFYVRKVLRFNFKELFYKTVARKIVVSTVKTSQIQC